MERSLVKALSHGAFHRTVLLYLDRGYNQLVVSSDELSQPEVHFVRPNAIPRFCEMLGISRNLLQIQNMSLFFPFY